MGVSTGLRPGFSPSYDLAQLLGGEGKFKSAMMVGSLRYGATLVSEKLLVGFTWLQEGTHYPMHAHHAAEVYQVLCGTASWGLTQHHLAPVSPGEYLYHPPATPHTIHVPPDEALLAIYAWTGHTSGSFWFADPGLATKYLPCLATVQEEANQGNNTENTNNTENKNNTENTNNIEKQFDELAEDYEAVIRAWGYNMPEIVAARLEELVGSLAGLEVVDVCCGSGLVAEALRARGVNHATGLDISANMLELAQQRGVYSSTIQADANDPLPVLDAECDIVVCVGGTKFLQPQTMDEWLRIVKKGGLVAFTHVADIADAWKKHEKEKEDLGQWERIWISDKLPYLPAVKITFWDYGKVHIYKKI